MKIVYSKDVINFLADLIEILYYEDYFGFKDSAKTYVEDLIFEIEENITVERFKFAPSYFDRYGKNLYYISCRKSKHTTWYVFFNYVDDIVYVRFIGNNHNIGQYL